MRHLFMFFTILLIVIASGDLFAGRLANIADSISGTDYNKMKQLKNVALGAGLFFTVVSGLLIFNRKKLMVPVVGSIVMLLLGVTLIAVKFVA